MAQLQSTNVVGTLCVNGVAVGGGKDFKFCCFTTSTNFTPSSDLVDGGGNVETIIVGAGGGGGGVALCNSSAPVTQFGYAAGGGGGGEVLQKYSTITSTDACCVVIGAGGTGGCAQACQFTLQQYVCPSAKGGNSTFLGNTAYGGGGGASAWGRNDQYANCYICVVDASTISGGPKGGCVGGWQASDIFLNLTNTGQGGSSTIGLPVQASSNCCNGMSSLAYCRSHSSNVSGSFTTNTNSVYSDTTIAYHKGLGFGIERFGEGGEANARRSGVGPYNALPHGGGGTGGSIGPRASTYHQQSTGGPGADGIVVLKWAE